MLARPHSRALRSWNLRSTSLGQIPHLFEVRVPFRVPSIIRSLAIVNACTRRLGTGPTRHVSTRNGAGGVQGGGFQGVPDRRPKGFRRGLRAQATLRERAVLVRGKGWEGGKDSRSWSRSRGELVHQNKHPYTEAVHIRQVQPESSSCDCAALESALCLVPPPGTFGPCCCRGPCCASAFRFLFQKASLLSSQPL